MPDDDYLTVTEFAALGSDQQLAVWDAANAGTVAYLERNHGHPRRYHRAQVLALLAGLAAAGTTVTG